MVTNPYMECTIALLGMHQHATCFIIMNQGYHFLLLTDVVSMGLVSMSSIRKLQLTPHGSLRSQVLPLNAR